MKRFLNFFFCSLGVLFFMLLCVGAYLWFADPFNVRPYIESLYVNVRTLSTEVAEGVEGRATEDKNPSLNASQERALELVGIDPANVPTSITPEQEGCFRDKLGNERVDEIVAGDTPTALEIFTARECIE